MPGRKQDCIWLYFEKEVQPGKTGCKAYCKDVRIIKLASVYIK